MQVVQNMRVMGSASGLRTETESKSMTVIQTDSHLKQTENKEFESINETEMDRLMQK